MKKYIFTENQVKRILDSVIEEQKTLTEQTDEINGKKAIQCFLNKVLGTNLEVDGLHGDSTKAAIGQFQQSKDVVDVDGVWGPQTFKRLNPKEKQILKQCSNEYGDIFTRIGNWLFN